MIKFIRRAGRVIPIRMAKPSRPSELEKIVQVARARKIVKAGMPNDPLHGAFWKYTKDHAKTTGEKIAKRISRFRMKGILKK